MTGAFGLRRFREGPGCGSTFAGVSASRSGGHHIIRTLVVGSVDGTRPLRSDVGY
jgi:hypothetical protein